MATPRTGRPRGRPPGAPNKPTAKRTAELAELAGKVAESRQLALGHLTDAEIATLLPRDIFRMVAHAAVKMGHVPLMLKAAEAWGPYEHPKLSSETLNVRTDDSQRDEAALRAEREEISRRRIEIVGPEGTGDRAGTLAPRLPEEPHGVVH